MQDVEFSSIKAAVGGRGGTLFVVQPGTQSNHFSTLCCLKACFYKQWEGSRRTSIHPVGNAATEFTNIIKTHTHWNIPEAKQIRH
jgi:hypothetical protein